MKSIVRSGALAWLALAALVVAALIVVMRAGRGLSFFEDDWSFVLGRRGLSARTFLEPHGEHPSVLPVAAFKLLLAVVGLDNYAPWRLAVALVHALNGVLLYSYARRRLGAWLALVPAALLLFLGAAWEDITWPFQIGFLGSVAGGLIMLLGLDAKRDWLACAGLCIAVTSSGLGLPFLIVAAVDIAFDARRWRRAWVVAVPAVILAIILLGFDEERRQPLARLSHAVPWAAEMAAAGVGAFGGLGADWGRPVLLAGLVALVLVLRRHGPRARLVALAAGALAFFAITALGRADLPAISPSTSRYLYLSATLLMLLVITALPPVRLDAVGGAVVGVATLVLCLAGAGLLRDGVGGRLGETRFVLSELAAVELAGTPQDPNAQIDTAHVPDITAGAYLEAVKDWGSPALPLAVVRTEPEDRRQGFDAALQRVQGLTLQPAPGARCTANPASGEITLAPGRYVVSADAPATLRLRRLAQGYREDGGMALAPGAPAALDVPRDGLADPWRAQSAPPVRVCPQ